jgi:hypothetical protein
MLKKTTIILLILLCLLFFLLNFTSSGLCKPSEENAGYALLDAVFVTFKELAEKREPIMEKTNKALIEMMKQAKRAKAQKQIDDIFFKRFHRILMVLKIVITPDDGSGIMGPLYFGEINKFIEDIEGEKFDVQGVGGHTAINKLSEAISHEIIDLRMYLDNKEKREKLIEEYQKQIATLSQDPSKLAEQDRQLMSMKGIVAITTAMTDYVTDFGIPPAQAGTYEKGGEFNKALSPFYIRILPIKDSWGHNFLVYSGTVCNGIYKGIKSCTEKDVIIISYGRDGKKENWTYKPENPQAGLFELKDDRDFDKDLVLWNGTWVRAPKGKWIQTPKKEKMKK